MKYGDSLQQMESDIISGVASPVLVPSYIRKMAATAAEEWNASK